MDVDSDVDSQLLQQFSSMGTTDKEVLIAELQKLLGNQLNPDGCAFFLDMNNWNLQAAVGAYYDYEQPTTKVPLMSFVKDITIGEGESVPPNTKFVKTWRIMNTGEEMWPPGCCLKFIAGEQCGPNERVMVDALQPGAVTDVSVDMVSPTTQGVHQGQWRMQTPTGMFFGEVIWAILQVEECGLLGLTQQMSTFGGDLATTATPHITHPHLRLPPSPAARGGGGVDNPFGSPVKSHSTSSAGVGFGGSPCSQGSPAPHLTPLSGAILPVTQHGVALQSDPSGFLSGQGAAGADTCMDMDSADPT